MATIKSILNRSFLKEFEEKDPVQIDYIRHKSLYYVLNNMYQTVWTYFPDDDYSLYNDAFIYLLGNVDQALPESASSDFNALESRFITNNWSLFKAKDKTHRKTKTPHKSV